MLEHTVTGISFCYSPTKTVRGGRAVVEFDRRPHLVIAGAAYYFSRLQRFIPFREIFDSEVQAPVCGVVHSGRYPLLILERAILEHVTGGAIRDNVGLADHAGVLHAERCKNALLKKVAPEFAAHFVNENSERDIAEIAVIPLFARRESEPLRRDHLQQLILSIISLQRETFRVITE